MVYYMNVSKTVFIIKALNFKIIEKEKQLLWPELFPWDANVSLCISKLYGIVII